jgi:hypothetical protein
MKSYADYYSAERIAKRMQIFRDTQARLEGLITWQEDVFVYGPSLGGPAQSVGLVRFLSC